MNDEKQTADESRQKTIARQINQESVRAFQIFDSLPEDQQAKLIEMGQARAEESLARMVDAVKRASEAAKAPKGYALSLIKRLFGESGGKDPNDPVFKKTWDNALRLGITVVMQEQGLLKESGPQVWKPGEKKLELSPQSRGLSEKARRLLGKKPSPQPKALVTDPNPSGFDSAIKQMTLRAEARSMVELAMEKARDQIVEHKTTIESANEAVFKNDAVPSSMIIDTRPETQAAAREAIAAGDIFPVSTDYLRRIAQADVEVDSLAVPDIILEQLKAKGYVELRPYKTVQLAANSKVIAVTELGKAYLEQVDANMKALAKRRRDEMEADLNLTPEQKAALDSPAAQEWFDKVAEALLTPDPNAPQYGPPKWLAAANAIQRSKKPAFGTLEWLDLPPEERQKLDAEQRKNFVKHLAAQSAVMPEERVVAMRAPGGSSADTQKLDLVKDHLTEQVVTVESDSKTVGILDPKNLCNRSLSGMHWWDGDKKRCKNCHQEAPVT